MLLTPLDIQKKEFNKSFRGYSEQDVDDFLDQLAQDYEALQRRNIMLAEKLEVSEAACSNYRDMETLIKDALVLAQKNADELLRNAKLEADIVLEEARLDAEKIIESAQRKANQLLQEAREKANFRIKEADEQVRNISAEYRFLEKQTHFFRIKFRSLLDAQLDLLDSQEQEAQELIHNRQMGWLEAALGLDTQQEPSEQTQVTRLVGQTTDQTTDKKANSPAIMREDGKSGELSSPKDGHHQPQYEKTSHALDLDRQPQENNGQGEQPEAGEQVLDIKQQDQGVTIRVRVQPKASKNEISGLKDGVLQVRITAPPVDGAANQASTEFLARKLGIAKSKVKIIQGHNGRHKLIQVDGLTVEQARHRLAVD